MGVKPPAVGGSRSFIAGACACVAGLAFASPAAAIETSGPAQLPPPPPPPAAPAPRARVAPASAAPGSVGAAAGPSADLGPDTGPHAFDPRWFLAPMLGFASDYLNFGVGLRGGKTFDNHLYVGGTFLYQLGESGGATTTVAVPGGPVTTSASWSSSGFYVGPEAGYDFDLRVVVVRPYMGLGVFSWTSSAAGPAAGGSTSTTQVVAWPGCTVLWNVPGSDFFLGGDVRLVTVPGGSIGLYALGGMHFGS